MFGRYTSQDVDRLIARKKYGKAAKILRLMLKKYVGNTHLRQKLADVLALDGATQEASTILEGLVEDFADDGFHTKAIAITKKIQRIDPERDDIPEKLAHLVHKREQTRSESLSTTMSMVEPELLAVPPADPESSAAADAAIAAAHPETPAEPPSPPPVTPPPEITAEVESLLEEEEGEEAPPVDGIHESPIFKEFSAAELEVLIHGLDLHTYEAGEIVISEGEPGTSLLVLASGRVRVYVKNDVNHQVEVRQLNAGEFFGEISILTGQPRSATVTAAEPSEILELSSETLNRIEEEFPRVAIVVREICDARTGSPEERRARQEINLPI